jgi:hypothetical protein
VSSWAVFAISVVAAFALHWLSGEFHPPRIGTWVELTLSVLAGICAVSASVLAVDQGWLMGTLSTLARAEPVRIFFGLVACAVPLWFLLAMLPASWSRFGISYLALAVFIISVPLQAYAFSGKVPHGISVGTVETAQQFRAITRDWWVRA